MAAAKNPQASTRAIECAEELRSDLPRLSFDSGYCLDAPAWLPAGSSMPYAFHATLRVGA